MLIRNLVDNAVRYGPRGARVDVRVRSDDGYPVLEVDDSGPGIPAALRLDLGGPGRPPVVRAARGGAREGGHAA